MMRAILGCVVVLLLSVGLTAEDKKTDIDAKKLVGKWEPKDKKEDFKFVIEFIKDGKVKVNFSGNGKDFNAEGTYKVEGNKLQTMIKIGDKEETHTRTISKLTDTELVSSDEKGKEDTLVRIKDK